MFGMGMGELLLILVVALLVVGPDKLPSAAKAIGTGIRDLRRHTQDLQDTIEKDDQLGEAVRDLRSALHGDVRSVVRSQLSSPTTAHPAAGTSVGSAPSVDPDLPRVAPAGGAIAKGDDPRVET